MFRLFERRSVVVPTWRGWLCLFIVALAPAAAWVAWGEAFLAVTSRVPADVLIVEAWTLEDGARAAADEFTASGRAYRWIVLTGGYTGERWTVRRWSQVEIAQRELERMGVPADAVIAASPMDSESARTFAYAIAAQRALAERHIVPRGVNVFTRGPHARRSRMVFAEVFGATVPVGVIAWVPIGSASGAWWRSSSRAEELLKESVAFAIDFMVGPGRAAAIFGGADAPGTPGPGLQRADPPVSSP